MNITVFEKFFSPSINVSILITVILCLLVFILGFKIRKVKPTDKPKGIMLLLELIVGFVNNYSKNYFGKYWRTYAPYILTLGLFLIVSNMAGLFGVRPPTASLNVTFGLALISFFIVHISGIFSQGIKSYLKGYLEPMSFLLPMNIIGEIAMPISLSLRLFGNILSGMIITGLVYGVLGNWAFLVTPALHGIFDIFFGGIQAVVFVLLTTIFVSMQLDLEEN